MLGEGKSFLSILLFDSFHLLDAQESCLCCSQYLCLTVRVVGKKIDDNLMVLENSNLHMLMYMILGFSNMYPCSVCFGDIIFRSRYHGIESGYHIKLNIIHHK